MRHYLKLQHSTPISHHFCNYWWSEGKKLVTAKTAPICQFNDNKFVFGSDVSSSSVLVVSRAALSSATVTSTFAQKNNLRSPTFSYYLLKNVCLFYPGCSGLKPWDVVCSLKFHRNSWVTISVISNLSWAIECNTAQ